MKTYYVQLVYLLWSQVTVIKSASNQKLNGGNCSEVGRIIGGGETAPHEFPSIVVMKIDGKRTCGGLIIDQEWIMSAGHCLAVDEPSRYTFLAGKHDQTVPESSEQKVEAVKMVLHDSFAFLPDTGIVNDIVVFKISPPLQLNEFVQKANLPKKGTVHSTGMATAVGWGMTENSTENVTILRKVSIPLWTNEDCKKRYEQLGDEIIFPGNICAGGEKDKGTCFGDSGGPLYFQEDGKQVVVGLTSWAAGCAANNTPTVFTRVAEYIDWLENTTGLSFSDGAQRSPSLSDASLVSTMENVRAKISSDLARSMCNGYENYLKDKQLPPPVKGREKPKGNCGWVMWSPYKEGVNCIPFKITNCKA